LATITNIATLIVPQLKPAAIAPHCRVSVQQIATLHKQGLSVTDIIAEYTFLNLAQVYAAYYTNQTEIEASWLRKLNTIAWAQDGWVEPMAQIRFYIDEDAMRSSFVNALRSSGLDIVTVAEVDRLLWRKTGMGNWTR